MKRMFIEIPFSITFATLLAACSCPPPEFTPYPGVRVVNMVPNSLSGETNQDSEPFLAVDRSNPNRMAGTAFTPNPFGSNGNAPVYVTADGGNTWSLQFIVPSNGELGTYDITVAATQTPARLYGGILKAPGNLLLNVLRSNDFPGGQNMTVQSARNYVDQPFAQAATVGGIDRLFVGDSRGNRPVVRRQ